MNIACGIGCSNKAAVENTNLLKDKNYTSIGKKEPLKDIRRQRGILSLAMGLPHSSISRTFGLL